ncbi:MAG: hypothetical protein ACJA2D_001383 [Pseudohongiellaceae bacterium]|jgi:hypothetical protein
MEFVVNCAWCESPKTAGPVCSSYGADYAKDEAIKQHVKVLSDNASVDLKNTSVPGLTIETSHNVLEIEDRPLRKSSVSSLFQPCWLQVY